MPNISVLHKIKLNIRSRCTSMAEIHTYLLPSISMVALFGTSKPASSPRELESDFIVSLVNLAPGYGYVSCIIQNINTSK